MYFVVNVWRKLSPFCVTRERAKRERNQSLMFIEEKNSHENSQKLPTPLTMYNARMLFADAEKAGVEKELPEKVWNAIGIYADECLRMGKGVKIPNLGSFSISNQTTSNTGKKRVFVIAGKFARSYGIPFKKVGYDMLAPCLEFNASRVAYKCNTEKDAVLHTLHTIVRVLGAAVASGQACRIMFNPLGSLLSQRRDVTFKFSNTANNSTMRSSTSEFSQNINPPISSSDKPLTLLEESRRQEQPYQPTQEQSLHQSKISSASSANQNSFLNTESNQNNPSTTSSRSNMMNHQPSTELTNIKYDFDYSNSVNTSNSPKPIKDQNDQNDDRDEKPLKRSNHSGGEYHGADIISVFPRFTPVEVLDKLKARHTSAAVTTNLKNAFVRVEEKLASENDALARETAYVEARGKMTKQLFLERKKRDAQRREELVLFLADQSKEAKEKRILERNDFLSTERLDPGCTYPLGSPADPATERRLKGALRAALDEQVEIKSNKDFGAKNREIDMDNFLIKCVRAEQVSDFLADRNRRGQQRNTLTASWEQQKDLAKRANDILSIKL